MQSTKNKIERIFRKGSGTFINRCYAIYNIIEEYGSNFGELLKYTFEINGFVESDNSVDALLLISKSQEETLRNDFEDIVKGIIKSLLKRDFEMETKFYEEYWKSINSEIFATKESRVFALYFALIDKRLPFWVLEPGIKMLNTEYRARQVNLISEISKIRFIIYNKELFEQKTEKASILFNVINSVEDVNDRIVLFSYCMDELEKGSASFINNLENLFNARL